MMVSQKSNFQSLKASRFLRGLIGMLFLYCILAFLHVYRGRMTGDEGFFALSARNVMHGLKPYRDFLFLQMPLLPYVYAAWFRICGPGIESARLLSALFGAGSITLIALACRRRGGDLAGAIGGLLVACNLSFVFDTATLKTQPLTIFLLAGVVFVLANRRPGKPFNQALLAMLFMSLAFFARLSVLPTLLLLWLYLAWLLRGSLGTCVLLLAANLVVLAAGFAFFYSDGNMLFGIYRWHQEYFEFPPWTWGHLGSVLRGWIGNQLPIILCFLCATWLFIRQQIKQSGASQLSDDALFLWFLLVSYWSITAIHLINVQSHPTHQTSITPFAVVFAAVVLAPVAASIPAAYRKMAWFGCAFVLGLSLPFQEWSLHLDGAGSVKKIQEVVSLIEPCAKSGDVLLSFNPEIAVNGNLRVPRGYELGEFTYLPKMTEERCRKLHMTNLQKLASDIGSRESRVFCMGNHELSVMSGVNADLARHLKALIDRNYRLIGSVTNYGQFLDEMFVYVVKE